MATVEFVEQGERFEGEFIGWTDDGWATVLVTRVPDVDWAREFMDDTYDVSPDSLAKKCECGNFFKLCHPEA